MKRSFLLHLPSDDDTVVHPYPSCNGRHHDVNYLLILDSDNYLAGAVVLDGNTAEELQPGQHDFIKLSQTTLYHDEDNPAWSSATTSFSGTPGSPASTL